MSGPLLNYVVGSGPAGVSAAHALLARGERVCLIDAGIQLEESRQEIVRRMGRQLPAEWSAEDLRMVKEGMDAGASGVLLKRIFGSDFAYRAAAEHIGTQSIEASMMPSLARGGLSNVWGAAMLPYGESDLQDWPITRDELLPHYAAVLGFTGVAAQHDDLDGLYPLPVENPVPLPLSRQAERLWQNLASHRDHLRDVGVHFGRARLAVKARREPNADGCITCGMCMYGCPYEYIYNSAYTLRSWVDEPRFQLLSGIIVERAEEDASGITLHGYHRETRAPWSVKGDRAFLAAGVLPSSKILLRSMEAYFQPVSILDSQYFLFPLLQFKRTPRVRDEALYTLSQLFLEITDPQTSPHTVHLQVYSYNDLIGSALRKTIPRLIPDGLVHALEDRMLIVQGYLHSSQSNQLQASLRRGSDASALSVRAVLDPEVPRRVRRVVRKLFRHARQLGAVPLEPMLQIARPGRGFHSGGSFPMSKDPGPYETDTLGRPSGWERLHVVDSTVFPSIAAPTVTFSVMANAHRIASVC